MNSVERRNLVTEGGWSSKFGLESKNRSHTLPRLVGKPFINYDNLKWLSEIRDLGSRSCPSSEEAHRVFMENYHRIFKSPISLHLKPIDKRKLVSTKWMHGAKDTQIPHDRGMFQHQCEGFTSHLCSHNISDHLAKLRSHSVTTLQSQLQETRVRVLRKLLRKMPFERKSKENALLYKHLRTFPELGAQIDSKILKELVSSVLQLDKWSEEGFTVFGNSCLYIILRGSVASLTQQLHLCTEHPPCGELPSQSLENLPDKQLPEQTVLSVGDCFGRLTSEDVKESNSRILSVVTLEPCEFLKISSSDYERVKQMLITRDEEQKLSLVQSCKLFQNWPKLSLKKIAELVKWKVFPAGHVLVKESEQSDVIGFIKKGQCLQRSLIKVAHTHPNGKKEKRTKAVVIGRLGPGDSFGESTVLKDVPMPWSVTAASEVELGTISALEVLELDDVTKSLLVQSYSAIDSNLTEKEIQKEHIEQEKHQQWRAFKKKTIRQVIFYRGIQPGYSKWSLNPSPTKLEKKIPS